MLTLAYKWCPLTSVRGQATGYRLQYLIFYIVTVYCRELVGQGLSLYMFRLVLE